MISNHWNNKGGSKSPFFVMHLPKLPTIFVKGDEERKAFFTIQAKELIAAGWVIKGSEEVPEKVEEKVESKPKARRTTKKVVEEPKTEGAEE